MRKLCVWSLVGLMTVFTSSGFAAAPPVTRPAADVWGDPLPEGAIARLGTARFRLGGHFESRLPAIVVFSPDGKLLAARASALSPSISLIDATTGREIRSIPAHDVSSFRFGPGGKELVTACHSSTYSLSVSFYDLAKGKWGRQFEAGHGEIVALSADGSVLAAFRRADGRKVNVTVCEVETGERRATIQPMHTSSLELALSPDGRYLATCSAIYPTEDDKRNEDKQASQTVQLWDTIKEKEWKRLDVGCQVRGIAFSPTKKTLAVSTRDDLQLWDVASGKRLKKWLVQSRSASSERLTFSPDGKMLVLFSPESAGIPIVWDLTSGRRVSVPRSPGCVLADVGFREGRIIAVGLRSQALVVWDLLSGKRVDADAGHVSAIKAILVRRDRVLTASFDHRVIEWDLTGKMRQKLPLPPDESDDYRAYWRHAVTFSPDGTTVAIAGREYGSWHVRSVKSGQRLISVSRGNKTCGPAYSPDGQLLAVAEHDYTKDKWIVSVVRPDSGEELRQFDLGAAVPAGLAFDPSGKRLAAMLVEKGVKYVVAVWLLDGNDQEKAPTKFEVKGLRRQERLDDKAPNNPIIFSPDGKLLAVSEGDGEVIYLLDARTGKERAAIKVPAVALPPVFSPDGRSLAVALTNDEGSSLSLWEMRTGKKRWETSAHSKPTALAFDSTGRVLISGHADTTALVWDVTGRAQTHKRRDDKGWNSLVDDLSSDDAQKAFAAQRLLAAGANLGVAELAKRVKPVGGKDPSEKELNALIEQLDDDEQEVRRKAFAALEQHAKQAEAALRKALAGKPSAELRRSATALLEKLRHVSPEALRAARAVEVLEWIGTLSARQLLADLATGHAGATLTLEAKAALARLQR